MSKRTHIFRLAVCAGLLVGCFPDANKIRPPANTGSGGSGGAGSGGGGSDGGSSSDGAAGTGGGSGGTGSDGRPTDGGGSDGPVTRAAICAQYSAARAAMWTRCSPIVLALRYGTEAAFRARIETVCISADLPGVNWPPIPFKDCSDALATQSCDDWVANVVPPVCNPPGQLGAGAKCGVSEQCQSSFCYGPSDQCGQCTKLPGLNETCFDDYYCVAGLVCGVDNKCVAPSVQAGECFDTFQCKGRLVCTNGVCEPPSQVGEDCFFNACDFYAGLDCDSTDVCVQFTTGASCSVKPDGSEVFCAASGACLSNNSCLPAAKDGAACDDSNGPFCTPPAECLNNVCVFSKPDVTCHP